MTLDPRNVLSSRLVTRPAFDSLVSVPATDDLTVNGLALSGALAVAYRSAVTAGALADLPPSVRDLPATLADGFPAGAFDAEITAGTPARPDGYAVTSQRRAERFLDRAEIALAATGLPVPPLAGNWASRKNVGIRARSIRDAVLALAALPPPPALGPVTPDPVIADPTPAGDAVSTDPGVITAPVSDDGPVSDDPGSDPTPPVKKTGSKKTRAKKTV